MNTQKITGYKVFNPDFTCRNFQFEEGKKYKHKGELEICHSGFHFCINAQDCFNYYDFNPNNIVCEVEALGKIVKEDGDSKCATDHIRIVRKLEWQEVLIVANSGSDNTGHSNSGNSNSGNRNSGNRNSGNSNSGNSNSGNRNSGDRNSGNRNSGDWNSGDSNSGDSNSGDSNSGDWNSGNRNSGDWNSGDWNSGNRNSGDWNSGNWNSGDWNSGNRNSGYSNSGNRNSGAFCTDQPKMRLFNKQSKWTFEDFEKSDAFRLMRDVKLNFWIYSENMTEEDKENHPEHETTGGYLKNISYKDAFQNAWGNWSEESRDAFRELPNFNAKIFEEITGVKTNKNLKPTK